MKQKVKYAHKSILSFESIIPQKTWAWDFWVIPK